MAKRRATYRADSAHVQGEGSHVILRRLPYSRARDAALMADKAGVEEEAAYTQQMIVDGVVSWNWVDDDDVALSLPCEVKDFDELGLLVHEVEFLVTHLTQAPDVKN